MSPPSPRLLLLEPLDSAFHGRIADAAAELGLPLERVDALDRAPDEPSIIGVGPSVRDPLDVARHVRDMGGQVLLVLFTASRSVRDALRAELLRDPFLYARHEVVDVNDTPRRLRSHLGQVLTRVERAQARGSARCPRRGSGRSTPRAAPAQGSDPYLASILAQAHEAIVSTDEHARVVCWNGAAERLLGRPAEAVLGHSLAALGRADPRLAELARLVEGVLASGKPTTAELRVPGSSGGERDVDLSLAPVRDAKDHLLGVTAVAEAESERERIDEALREANGQKDEFLAIMSHELRTPLTTILGYTDMLLRGLSGPLPPRTTKYVANVRSAGDRLLELVNGLLDYTRLEAGVERLEFERLELSALVREVVQVFAGQATSKRIRLDVRDEAPGTIDGDRDKLQHVLRSYLNNALKFTPSGGHVSVHVGGDPAAPEHHVRVAVTDSGIGLRDEQLSHVWERFYQGDASLTRPYGGMGLGLSIARHLVLLHGGAVGAESRGPGLGSTFWFSLPRPQHRSADGRANA